MTFWVFIGFIRIVSVAHGAVAVRALARLGGGIRSVAVSGLAGLGISLAGLGTGIVIDGRRVGRLLLGITFLFVPASTAVNRRANAKAAYLIILDKRERSRTEMLLV